jgi:hypothetical protein
LKNGVEDVAEFKSTGWHATSPTRQHCTLGAVSVGYLDDGAGSLFSVGTVRARGGSPREICDSDEFAIGSITKMVMATRYVFHIRYIFATETNISNRISAC